jgi:Domain of unknown function (DUF4440)
MAATTYTDTDLGTAYEEVVAGLRAGDQDLLRRRVAPECRVVGPKGFLIDREEWIASHDGQVFEMLNLETVESEVARYDETATRLDLQRSECLFNGEQISGLYRVLSVWRAEPAGWQLRLIQYTAVSPEAQTAMDD